MSISSAISSVVESVAIWLNPERREKVILRRALEAAEELLLILRNQGRYAKMSEAKRTQHEIHYQRQFDAWRDGAT